MIHYQAHGVTVHHGDCLDVLATLPDNSIDAVVTDPPYGLEFMGKEWDSFAPERGQYHGERADTSKNIGTDDSKPSSRHHVSFPMGRPTFRRCRLCAKREFSGSPCRCDVPEWDYEQPAGTPTRMAAFQQWCEAWAAECLRVLKPGGHLLAFGGTRTAHRLTSGIEDAGFEIRDSVAWLYGSGFPKSSRVGRGARYCHCDATVHTSSIGFPVCTRCGRLNVDGLGTALKPAHEPVTVARKPLQGTVAANVLAWGTGAINIDAGRIGTEVRAAAYTSFAPAHGNRLGAPGTAEARRGTQGEPQTYVGRWPANVALDEWAAAELDTQSGASVSSSAVRRNTAEAHNRTSSMGSTAADWETRGHADTGGASRFMYVAKADRTERPRVAGAAHPTVKPLALMRWLVRLVTPPGGIVLDPFAGSGTTAEACLLERFRCITIERDDDYLPLILARITRQRDPVAHVRLAGDDSLTLFDEEA